MYSCTRTPPVRYACRLAPCLLVILTGWQTGGAVEPTAVPARPPSAPGVNKLGLKECLDLALERQPRLAAQRAGLAAAQDGSRALQSLHAPAALAPELPIRRRQAALGVAAAAAGVDQAEKDATYAVTRAYFTVLYAREQERIAAAVVERLTAIHDSAQRTLKAGARDVTATDVNRTSVYLRLARTKKIQAEQGVKRALAGLGEAIGLEHDSAVDVPPGKLPVLDVQPQREEIIAWALERRAEIVRANIFAQVTCLEIEAQGTGMHKRMETFAAGSDIHAILVAQEVREPENRPGAVPPEMPTLLAGSRPERVRRAESLHARANAVVEVTRNLIALEAQDAFLRWEEAARALPEAQEAASAGDRMADELTKDFTAGLKVKVEEVVNTRVLASQARAQYNELLHRQLVALAELERITAGGFWGLRPDDRVKE